MSMITIAVAVATLGIFLSVSFANTAYETATTTLKNVTSNASLALQNSVSSAETSMQILANQIGNKTDFANAILDPTTDANKEAIKKALSGENDKGEGDSIIGLMDYLIRKDADIVSANMYSKDIDAALFDENGNIIDPNHYQATFKRLYNYYTCKVKNPVEKYDALLKRPGDSFWFFQNDQEIDENDNLVEVPHLYVWKALFNSGVTSVYDMKVVGFVEYQFNRNAFLGCISDTLYENEGMLLFDENNQLVLDINSGDEAVDKAVRSIDFEKNQSAFIKGNNYTVIHQDVGIKDWKYITYINHRSINKTNAQSRNLTILIVSISVLVATIVSYLLTAREIKRIKKLSLAAGEISDGNYDIHLQRIANDEITDVSESFNTMVDKVQEALQELILQQDSISENFATILSNKSGESGNHVKRVSEYSAVLAQELGLSKNEVHDIRIASMLHDVGKIMIDENILHKPGRFTLEEYAIMQQHVNYGGKLLEGVPGNIMQLGAIIAMYHHERWDGLGYTHHLKGDQIPLAAQIASVADVFDALVSKRCYKDAWTIEQARDEIIAQSGQQFSPKVVEAFEKRFEDFKQIAEIYKND